MGKFDKYKIELKNMKADSAKYEFIALNIPMKHVHAPGKCNKGMVGKLSKHLRISADDEDDDDIAVELPEGDISEGPQEIDPRWNELKKILDNN